MEHETKLDDLQIHYHIAGDNTYSELCDYMSKKIAEMNTKGYILTSHSFTCTANNTYGSPTQRGAQALDMVFTNFNLLMNMIHRERNC